jgi:hypothetical protein
MEEERTNRIHEFITITELDKAIQIQIIARFKHDTEVSLS